VYNTDKKYAQNSFNKKSKSSSIPLEFPNETFKSDGYVLLCVACGQSISCLQRSLIIQHINTSKHKENKWEN